jgi:hypothetical protein
MERGLNQFQMKQQYILFPLFQKCWQLARIAVHNLPFLRQKRVVLKYTTYKGGEEEKGR